MRHKGKVALVTGAARGIGRSTAMLLAEEGAKLGLVDIEPEVKDTEKEIKKNGEEVLAVVLDVSDAEQVHRGVNEITRKLGSVDILVNNAGIVHHINYLTAMKHEEWEKEIKVNLFGAFHFIKEVLDEMMEKRWGRIINMSSGAATGGLHKQAGYAASKAGILGLTMTVTLECARYGITCNAILPGLVNTELVQMMPEDLRKRANSVIPARRLGEMEEVAHLISFLASDHAAYINGAQITIDGGMTLNIGTLGSRKELKEMDSYDE